MLSARGYGITDTKAAEPIDAHTVFRLASLSKAFAGTLTGMLVSDGFRTRVVNARAITVVKLGEEGTDAVDLISTDQIALYDGLGFVEGAAWDEHTVGTNAIGTALVVRKPVQAYSAEHFVRVHHASPPEPAPAFRGRGRLDAADPRVGPTRLTQIRQEGPGRKGDPEVAPWPGALTTRPGRRAAEPGQVHRALPGSQRATGSTRRRWSSTLRTTAPAGSRYATAETTHATSMAADVGTAPRR